MPELTDAESVSTRDRLRAAAAELFAERGYVGASMTGIAKMLGLRKPSLYNYYPSKEELFLELLERSLAAWSEASGSAVEETGSYQERLRTHLGKTVDFAAGNPHAMALCRLAVAQVAGEFGDRVQAHLLEERVDYQREMEAFFAQAQDAGEVATETPEVLALAWLTFLDGVLTHQLFAVGERRPYFLDHLDELWRLFWRGIAAHGESDV